MIRLYCVLHSIYCTHFFRLNQAFFFEKSNFLGFPEIFSVNRFPRTLTHIFKSIVSHHPGKIYFFARLGENFGVSGLTAFGALFIL